jgi:hypothetical protein
MIRLCDGKATVGALCYGSLTAGHSHVVVNEFNLTVYDYRTIAGLTAKAGIQ